MKLKSSFICQQCGYETPQWYGKCPNCGEWNTLVETVKDVGMRGMKSTRSTKGIVTKSQRLSDVKHIEKYRLKSGFGEFDRVMGGGIVPGSVTLLAGDPGIGKSTLILHVLSRIGGLYVTGEESAEQVKLRAKRLGIGGDNIDILAETGIATIVANFEFGVSSIGKTSSNPESRIPKLVIIDSIQAIATEELDSLPGSVGQIRRCAELLISLAKGQGIPMFIIGHVTKEGTIAGPKVLEHMVDTVLYLEGERYMSARILRTFKNRFGATEEVGIFEMKEDGLKEVSNPSALFLSDRVKNVSGSAVTVLLEGSRPILVEIQALVVPSQIPMPKRVANGFDYNRLQLLIAILQKRLSLPLGNFDIFVNVSGGLKISEPAADLSVALAIISSFKNKPIDPKVAVMGELGLLGEVRTVGREDLRTKEAKRLGFTTVASSRSVRNVKAASGLIG